MDTQFLMNFAVIAFICLVIFLICREIVCWYFKMNEVVSLLKDIKASLQNNAPNKKTEL